MSNDSKFLQIQQDPCDVPPEEEPIDRVCPTCIPNPAFIPPDWFKQSEPWLNEATCEYSVAVFVNQDGDSYRLSDLKDILEPQENNPVSLSESGIPINAVPIVTSQNYDIKKQDAFERIKRGFIKSGIRSLLRFYNKLEADEIVCAKKDCSIITSLQAQKYVR